MRGQFLIAPGGFHLLFDPTHGARLVKGAPVNGVRPAADVTLKSLAHLFRSRVIGIVLTGMGKDGLEGARRIHENGGRILAQCESSSVVYGMPRRVVEAQLAQTVADPETLGSRLGQMIGS